MPRVRRAPHPEDRHPRARFGWLLLAVAPGCFSGVAACFVAVPVVALIGRRFTPGQGPPTPVIGADIFGFLSAASVWFMYRHRHRIMSWTARRQASFAAAIWGTHILAFGLVLLAMWYWY